jgi:hypothetical protein
VSGVEEFVEPRPFAAVSEYFDHFDAAGTDVSGHHYANQTTVDARKQLEIRLQASSTSGDLVGLTQDAWLGFARPAR